MQEPEEIEQDSENELPLDNSRSSLERYTKEIQDIPLLTREEEILLGQRVSSHNSNQQQTPEEIEKYEEARKTFINSNLRLVVKIAHDFKGKGVHLEDLISEGNLGLIRAAEKFDPTKGAKFSSYAAWWIKRYMINAIAKQKRDVRVPTQMQSTMYHIKKATEKFEQDYARKPTVEELSKLTGFRKGTILYCKQNEHRGEISLQEKIQEGDDGTFMDIIEDPNAESPLQELTRKDNLSFLKKVVHTCLDERERRILNARFGIYGNNPKILEELAKELGCSRERVRQIGNDALMKVREEFYKQSGEDFKKVREEERYKWFATTYLKKGRKKNLEKIPEERSATGYIPKRGGKRTDSPRQEVSVPSEYSDESLKRFSEELGIPTISVKDKAQSQRKSKKLIPEEKTPTVTSLENRLNEIFSPIYLESPPMPEKKELYEEAYQIHQTQTKSIRKISQELKLPYKETIEYLKSRGGEIKKGRRSKKQIPEELLKEPRASQKLEKVLKQTQENNPLGDSSILEKKIDNRYEEAYQRYQIKGESVATIAQKLGLSYPKTLEYLKSKGAEIKRGRRLRIKSNVENNKSSEEKRRKILDNFELYEGNASLLAKDFRINVQTVINILSSEGIIPQGKAYSTLEQMLHPKLNFSYASLKTKYSKDIWSQVDQLDEKQKNILYSLYKDKKTLSEISKKQGYAEVTLASLRKKAIDSLLEILSKNLGFKLKEETPKKPEKEKYSSRSLRKSFEESMINYLPREIQNGERDQVIQEAYSILKTLPERDRMFVQYYFKEKLSRQEVSNRLAIKEPSIDGTKETLLKKIVKRYEMQIESSPKTI